MAIEMETMQSEKLRLKGEKATLKEKSKQNRKEQGGEFYND